MQQVVEDLKAARDLIAKGWVKGRRQIGDRYCILGAVSKAATDLAYPMNNRAYDAVAALQDHIPLTRNHFLRSCSQFNDSKDTTHQDVLDLFDKTIADLGGMA